MGTHKLTAVHSPLAERDLIISKIMAAKIVLVLALSACALAGPSYYGGYGRGIAAHPGGYSYTYRSPQGLGKREAEPGYGYGGSYQRVTRIDGYDGQLTTYGVRTNGNAGYVDEPKFGRLGKREAEPGYGYGGPGIASHPYGGSSYTYRSPQGLGKREAEPGYGYGYGRGIAAHPYGGSSYTYRSPQGLGKREAEPGYGYGGSYQRVTRIDGYDRQLTSYGVATNGYGAYVDEPRFGRLGKREAEPGYGYGYGRGIAAHPYGGSSYTYRSPQGLGKREAEPGYGYGYGRGIAAHPYGGSSFTYRSPQGLGKREAEPGYGYGGPGIAAHPYGGSSYTYRSPQGLRGKRDAEPSYGSYSFQNVRRVGGYGQLSAYDVRTNGYNAAVGEIRLGY